MNSPQIILKYTTSIEVIFLKKQSYDTVIDWIGLPTFYRVEVKSFGNELGYEVMA